MGVRTGKPRGRPKGARNKKSVDFEKKLAAKARAIDRAVKGAFTGTSHDYLMGLYKDPDMPVETRMDAAKACLPYERPRLSSIEVGGSGGQPIVVNIVGKAAKL